MKSGDVAIARKGWSMGVRIRSKPMCLAVVGVAWVHVGMVAPFHWPVQGRVRVSTWKMETPRR
jgi:hypothetical protein